MTIPGVINNRSRSGVRIGVRYFS